MDTLADLHAARVRVLKTAAVALDAAGTPLAAAATELLRRAEADLAAIEARGGK